MGSGFSRKGMFYLPMAILGAALLAGCEKPPQMQMPVRPPASVTVVEATTRDVPVYIDEIGRTTASELVNIQPQVTGQVLERHFEDGADLKKGQLLFVIDRRPFQADVNQQQANLEQAKAQENMAQAEYERYEKAYHTGAASIEDYDSKKLTRDTTVAQVKVKQAALETSQLNLNYCTITCPIDGRAGQRLVDVGNVVKANDTTMLTIQRIAPIYADFTITELDLPRVRSHMANGDLHAQVTLPQSPKEIREGTLTFLDTNVQPNAGRINLRATLSNEDRYFWPGQFVDIRLVLDVQKNAVLIPYACTQMGQKGPFVYVVKSDNTADQRPITLGQRQGGDDDLIVVLSGVEAGETVIRTGQLSVSPGGKVNILPPVTAEAPATGAPASSPSPEAATQPTTGASRK